MKTIRLHNALITPNYFKSISFEIDLSAEELLLERNIHNAKGTVTMEIRNTADIVTVRFFGSLPYNTVCDRCLSDVNEIFSFDYTKDVKSGPKDETFDGIMLAGDDSFDYEQEVVTEVLISFPAKHLCSEDCKGLCPVCGCNQNEQTCSCVQKELDPRLEVLRNLKW